MSTPHSVAQPVAIGNVQCGPGLPLVWIAGPCAIESHDLTLSIADTLRRMADLSGDATPRPAPAQ